MLFSKNTNKFSLSLIDNEKTINLFDKFDKKFTKTHTNNIYFMNVLSGILHGDDNLTYLKSNNDINKYYRHKLLVIHKLNNNKILGLIKVLPNYPLIIYYKGSYNTYLELEKYYKWHQGLNKFDNDKMDKL